MTLGVIGRLFRSRSATVALGIIAASSVLMGVGKLPVDDWKDLMLGIGIAYVGGGQLVNAASALKRKEAEK